MLGSEDTGPFEPELGVGPQCPAHGPAPCQCETNICLSLLLKSCYRVKSSGFIRNAPSLRGGPLQTLSWGCHLQGRPGFHLLPSEMSSYSWGSWVCSPARAGRALRERRSLQPHDCKRCHGTKAGKGLRAPQTRTGPGTRKEGGQ